MDAERSVLSMPDEFVRTVVRRRYGIEPLSIDRCAAEYAVVCRITTADETLGFKAELLNPVDRAMFEWQTEVQARLASAGLPVAMPIIDLKSQSRLAELEVARGVVAVQLYPWQTGMAFADVLPDDQALVELGRTAARLRTALDGVPKAPFDRTHVWELSRSGRSIAQGLASVRDPRIRVLVSRAQTRFVREVQPLLNSLPRAVVHQDMHDSNVLMARSRSGVWRTSAILDFGDMLNGVRIADLIVMSAYASRNCPDPVAAIAKIVRGWSEDAAISDEELCIVVPGAAARLAVNLSVWSSRAGGTQGAYAVARMSRSVEALETLLVTDTRQLRACISSK